MHPRVYIIILNWNGRNDTLECLRSISNIDYPNFTVIVADNGSTDNSVEAIQRNFPQYEVIQNGANLGFAEGNNRGISKALESKTEYVFIGLS